MVLTSVPQSFVVRDVVIPPLMMFQNREDDDHFGVVLLPRCIFRRKQQENPICAIIIRKVLASSPVRIDAHFELLC